MRNVIAEPAAEVGGGGVENVVNGVEDDGEAGSASHAVLLGEHLGCVKNQQSVGEIACAENANAKKEFAEGCGKSLQAVQKSFPFLNGDGAFANEEPEAGNGDQAGNERVEKDLAVGLIGGFEKPERG